jgi:hypothetical protein
MQHTPLMMLRLFWHLQLIAQSYATITTPTNAEDLTQFAKGPERCPGLLSWKQALEPLSCDDPACRGISWAVPPYRCRQPDGVMNGHELFGCRCCPRVIDCDDPRCAGNSQSEICHSELLADCICVSSNRRVQTFSTSTPHDAAEVQVEDAVAGLAISESSNNDVGGLSISRNCPRGPPVRCLDPQCRDADDWQTETPSTPRCSQANGLLVIDGTETALHGCPCCPEYIECSFTECNGGADRACTSVPLRGCFCDWPGRGPVLTDWTQINDEYLVLGPNNWEPPEDSNPHSGGYQPSSTNLVLFTASQSTSHEARPLATHRSTAPVLPPNFTGSGLLLNRQQPFSLPENNNVITMPHYLKDA